MKKLLVVVDFQNDFVNGSLGFERADELDAKICAKIDKTLSEGGEVVFTLDTHGANYLETLEGKNLPVAHCVKGTKGHEVFGATAGYLSRAAAVYEKDTFGSDRLFFRIASHAYDEIELCGLVTNICVLCNAVLAKTAAPQTPVVVDSGLVMSFDGGLHEKTLDVLKGIQVEVK